MVSKDSMSQSPQPSYNNIEIGKPWREYCAKIHKRHPHGLLFCLDCGVGRTSDDVPREERVFVDTITT